MDSEQRADRSTTGGWLSKERPLVLVLLTLGLILRAFPILWGSALFDPESYAFHPDEPKLVRQLDDFPSSLQELHDYRYPTLLPIVYGAFWSAVGDSLGWRDEVKSKPGNPSYEKALIFGRAWNVILFGLGGMWITWALTRRLFGPGPALLALVLLNGMGLPLTSVALVQTDVPSTVWLALAVLLLARWEQAPRMRTMVGVGLTLGAATATKYTAAIGFAVLAMVLAEAVWRRRLTLAGVLRQGGLAVVAAALLFTTFVPGMVSDTGNFVSSLKYEFTSKLLHSTFSAADFWQSVAANYPLWMLLLAALGLLLTWKKSSSWLMPSVIASLLLHMVISARSYRPDYAIVMFPFIAAYGGAGLSRLLEGFPGRSAGRVLLAGALLIHALSAAIVYKRYSAETRYRFADVLREHVPPGPVGSAPSDVRRHVGAMPPEGYKFVSVHGRPEWIVLFWRRSDHALRALQDPEAVRARMVSVMGEEETARLFSTEPGARKLLALKERDFRFYEDVLLGQRRQFQYDLVEHIQPESLPLDFPGEDIWLYRRTPAGD